MCLSCALCPRKSDCIWVIVAVKRNCFEVEAGLEQQKPLGENILSSLSNPSFQVMWMYIHSFIAKYYFPIVLNNHFSGYSSCSNLWFQRYKLMWYSQQLHMVTKEHFAILKRFILLLNFYICFISHPNIIGPSTEHPDMLNKKLIIFLS